jgi:hypothetical protein
MQRRLVLILNTYHLAMLISCKDNIAAIYTVCGNNLASGIKLIFANRQHCYTATRASVFGVATVTQTFITFFGIKLYFGYISASIKLVG